MPVELAKESRRRHGSRTKRHQVFHSSHKHLRKTKRRHAITYCNIPIQVPALRYSSPLRNNDFYTWVNQEWLQKAKIKSHESLVDAGNEPEECLYETSMRLVKDIQKKDHLTPFEQIIHDLANSALHSRAQQNSVHYLKQYLNTLHCISTTEDVFRTAVELATNGFKGIFDLQITLDAKGTCQLSVEPNPAGLYMQYYKSRDIQEKYKAFLERLGKEFDLRDLPQSIHVERYIQEKLDEYYSGQEYSLRGSALLRKFPGIPWEILFTQFHIHDWKTRTIYYTSPRFIRFIGRMLKETPIDTWKSFFARCYIVSSLPYLPPPFDELDHGFFGRILYGMKTKTPQHQLLFDCIRMFLSNDFSEYFWKKEGNVKLQHEVENLVEQILDAAKVRVKEADWLEAKTRKKADEKLDRMKQSVAIPSLWLPFVEVTLDPKNLLKNRMLLAQRATKQFMSRLDKRFTFWEDMITRVNASYYKQSNLIVIPYGQLQPPFYASDAPLAWNFGALGSIIGHEICHGFDEDGKEYDAFGKKKQWWSQKNNRRYKKKTKALEDLFSAVVMQGHRIQGERMVSENLADLAGLAIALQALKKQLGKESPGVLQEAYRTFFIAFATSWRTKYREERLTRLLEKDIHAPAQLRVNLVVSQFDEWYTAFSITEESPLYRKPEDRIRIF